MSEHPEVLIGVTAGIAAYKACTLVSRLVQSGVGVTVMMTREATQLVAPRTFQSLSGRGVLVEMFPALTSESLARQSEAGLAHPHIEPARRADLLAVVPATANILGKAANGIADDLLSTTLLAFDGPVLFAPAMNAIMWKNKAVQRNVAQLREDGHLFVGPAEGHLACGETGAGRMAEPEEIFDAIMAELKRLKG